MALVVRRRAKPIGVQHHIHRCALRTVTEHLRQTAEAPYADFERHVRPLAAEAGVALLSQFAATWSGARLGVLLDEVDPCCSLDTDAEAVVPKLLLDFCEAIHGCGAPFETSTSYGVLPDHADIPLEPLNMTAYCHDCP